MQITNLKTWIIGNPWKRWIFLKVETDGGLYGIGECHGHNDCKNVLNYLKETEEKYLGTDPRNLEGLRDRFSAKGSPHKINQQALAGLEMACLDIKGKSLDAPVYELLGGKVQDEIEVYANGWYQHLNTVQEWGERARQVVDRGYQALKFDPFGNARHSLGGEELETALARIRAIDEAVGDEADLLVEGHRRFTLDTAFALCRDLEEINPGWLEQPLDLHLCPRLLPELQKSFDITLAGAEHVHSIPLAEDYLELEALDVFMVDPQYCGGLMNAKLISDLAGVHGVSVAPHQATGPIHTAACLHLSATLPNFKILEHFEEFAHPEWVGEIIDAPIKAEDGKISVGALDRPGLGIDFSEKAADKYPPGPNHREIDLYEEGWENRSGVGKFES